MATKQGKERKRQAKLAKQAESRFKRLNISRPTNNVYLERISRAKWIKIYTKRIWLTFIFLLLLLFVITSIITNIIGYFLIENNVFWNTLFLVVPYQSASLVHLIWVFPALFAPTLTLIFYRDYLTKRFARTNWDRHSEINGTAHFLSDERTPWTTKPKVMNKFFASTYFLKKGNWIIRSQKTGDVKALLHESLLLFEFKQPAIKDLNYYLNILETPLGSQNEIIEYTCANDVITRLRNLSGGKLKCSEKEYLSKMDAFITRKNLRPVLFTNASQPEVINDPHAKDAANAIVIGGTGSGKTVKLNYPTILANANAIQQPSMLIADPKGELNSKLSGYLHAQGYEVFSLDLFVLTRSMGWNPLQEIYQKFLAKSVLNIYLSQYHQWKVFFNTKKVVVTSDERAKLVASAQSAAQKRIEEIRTNWYNLSIQQKRNLFKQYGYDFKPSTMQAEHTPTVTANSGLQSLNFGAIAEEFAPLVETKFIKEMVTDDEYNISWIGKPYIDNRTAKKVPFDLPSFQQWQQMELRYQQIGATADKFVFDTSVLPKESIETDHLCPKEATKKHLDLFVCSIHSQQKPRDFCICDNSEDRLDKYIFFDNYIFKTLHSLELHFSTTLSTDIGEQISAVKNTILPQENAGKDSHWNDNAGKIFTGIVYHFGYKLEDDIHSFTDAKFNISSIYNFALNKQYFNYDKMFEEFVKLGEQQSNLTNSWSDEMKRYRYSLLSSRQDLINLSSYFNVADNPEGGSIFSTFSTKFDKLINPGVRQLSSFSDITFEKLADTSKPKAILVGFKVDDSTYHPFVVLFISLLHKKLSDRAKRQGGALARYFLFMLDEFGNIPTLPDYGKILSTCRSENIKFMSIIQSKAQLEKNYSKDTDTIIANCGFNVYIKTDEYDTAEYYSKLLGTHSKAEVRKGGAKDGFVTERKNVQKTSLLDTNELLTIDAKKYHDTLFLTNSHRLLVQAVPYYMTYSGSSLSSHRPIQQTPNIFNEIENFFYYPDHHVVYDNYWVDFTNKLNSGQIQPKIEQSIDVAIENQAAHQMEVAKAREQQIIKETKEKIDKVEEKISAKLINQFADRLIADYNLEFAVDGGIAKDIFKATIDQWQLFKMQLFHHWPLFNFYKFAFSEKDFRIILNDFLSRSQEDDKIETTSIADYNYVFESQDINKFYFLIAENLLSMGHVGPIFSDVKQLQFIKPHLDQLQQMLSYILNYELFEVLGPDSTNHLSAIAKLIARGYDETAPVDFYGQLIAIVDSHLVRKLELAAGDKSKVNFYGINNEIAIKIFEQPIHPLFVTRWNILWRKYFKLFNSTSDTSVAKNVKEKDESN